MVIWLYDVPSRLKLFSNGGIWISIIINLTTGQLIISVMLQKDYITCITIQSTGHCQSNFSALCNSVRAFRLVQSTALLRLTQFCIKTCARVNAIWCQLHHFI